MSACYAIEILRNQKSRNLTMFTEVSDQIPREQAGPLTRPWNLLVVLVQHSVFNDPLMQKCSNEPISNVQQDSLITIALLAA